MTIDINQNNKANISETDRTALLCLPFFKEREITLLLWNAILII